jgi:site-specific DNA-cytosine methylase
MFTTAQSNPPLSPSDRLARILAWLETGPEWAEKKVVLSSKQLGSLATTAHLFLSGKMLKEHSAQTLVQTFGQYSKPLPTLGVTDLNGNCLTLHGFYPKIESESTLSDILMEQVDQKYFAFSESDRQTTTEGLFNSANIKNGTINTVNNGPGLSFDSGTTLICDNGLGHDFVEQSICPTLRSNTSAGYGNYVKIHQRKRGLNTGGDKSISPTITSNSFNHNNHVVLSNKHQQDRVYSEHGKMAALQAGTHGNAAHLTKTMVGESIRRLTEIECERLQGFPDDWTKYGLYQGKVKEVSATQRYKLMGNAVTVAVVEEITKRLLKPTP